MHLAFPVLAPDPLLADEKSNANQICCVHICRQPCVRGGVESMFRGSHCATAGVTSLAGTSCSTDVRLGGRGIDFLEWRWLGTGRIGGGRAGMVRQHCPDEAGIICPQ